MFNWVRDTLGAIWFFLRFAFIIVAGYMLFLGLLWLLRQPFIMELLQGSATGLSFLGRFETAVKTIGSLFLGIWGLRFLDQFFLRDWLINRFGFVAQAPLSPFRLFFSNFLHGNPSHLIGNTRPLLAFSGIAALMLPSVNLLLLLFLFLIVIQGMGVWIFGQKSSSHIGASGLALGLFSFDVSHGLFAGGWVTAVAILLLLISGRSAYRALTSRGTLQNGAQISVVGHLWGFLSGIFAAYLISPFGPFNIL